MLSTPAGYLDSAVADDNRGARRSNAEASTTAR